MSLSYLLTGMGLEKLLVGVPVALGAHAVYSFYSGVQEIQQGFDLSDIGYFGLGGIELLGAGVATMYALRKIKQRKIFDTLEYKEQYEKDRAKQDSTLKDYLDS
jgi:hypothetical protein